MEIPEFVPVDEQACILGNHKWNVPRLIFLSRNLPVINIPLDHLNIYTVYTEVTLREMVMHMNAVMNADLNKPIILDEDGDIMDGRHRIMKALFLKKKTIKAVRFDVNPYPDSIQEN